MDNASFHRKEILRELAKKVNVNIIFLPTYSPDYNPIEKSWANATYGIIYMIFQALNSLLIIIFLAPILLGRSPLRFNTAPLGARGICSPACAKQEG
jgi:transposase